jgi:hypothetical protein
MLTVINKPREIIYTWVILQSYVGLQESFFAAAICAYRIRQLFTNQFSRMAGSDLVLRLKHLGIANFGG